MSKNIGRRRFMQTAGVVAMAGLASKTVYADDGKALVIGISCSPREGKTTATAIQVATLWNTNNDDILKDEFGIESAKKLGLRVAETALRCQSEN